MSIDRLSELRLRAEADLSFFIELVAPHRVLGRCHREMISWMTRIGCGSHQLVLFPRDHGKSAMIGYRCAWEIVRNPAIRIIYISSTSNLAEKQLKFIKDILTSEAVGLYWPELINRDEGRREKWTAGEISVDHPIRREEGIRDPTVFTAGLTTSITGLHCDVAILDDIVVQENAYTEEGRRRCREQYSLLASIEGGDAREWAVGTRYHPKDLYSDLQGMQETVYDKDGLEIGVRQIYEVMERAVEDRGDGTGRFLWPRQMRRDGKWFGFDREILAKKRGQYLDKVQFRAQYYNDPNDTGSSPIKREQFKYYNPRLLLRNGREWHYNGRRMNIIAAMDFSYSMGKGSDYSVIAVAGLDTSGQYYVLDIDRFLTSDIAEYFKHIQQMYTKWQFRTIVLESNVAQEAIANSLREHYINPNGLSLSVKKVKHTRSEGTKEERIGGILIPKYSADCVWHGQFGEIQTLEEELIQQFPTHDDAKDALAEAFANLVRPSVIDFGGGSTGEGQEGTVQFNSRYGGVI